MVKRPLVWVLAIFAAGCLCRKTEESVFLIFLVFSFFLIFYLRREPFLFLLPFFFLIGFFAVDQQLTVPLFDQVLEKGQDEQDVTLWGTVKRAEEKQKTTAVTLTGVTVQKTGDSSVVWEIGQVLLYTKESGSLYRGNRIMADGTISRFQEPSNLGQFDENMYYRSKNISYKMYADKYTVTDTEASGFYRLLANARSRLAAVYGELLNETDAGIIRAMVLGEKNDLDREIKGLYQKNGIAHILAISGLHVSCVGLSLYRLLRKCGASDRLSVSVTIAAILCYGAMTGFSVSTIRAVVMMILFLVSRLIGKTYDMLSGACFAALIILIREPLQLFQCGFLLSFGAIFGIGTILPVLEKLAPEWGWHNLFKSFLMSFSIQIVTLPIILFYYFEFPLYGVFLNLIILPLASIVLILSILGGIAGCVFLPLGGYLAGGVHYILLFYEWICNAFLKLPGSSQITGKPQLWQIVLFYLFVLTFLFRNRGRKSILLLLAGAFLLFLRLPDRTLRITVLDVGQGEAIVLQMPDGTAGMIDGGSTDTGQVGHYRIIPFLKANGIKRLTSLFITHGDEDHVNGIIELIEEAAIPVGNLFLPGGVEIDEAYQKLIDLCIKNRIKITFMTKGDRLSAGNVNLTCLHPYEGFYSDSRNDHSLVLKLSMNRFAMLLTGDLTADGERVLDQINGQSAGFDVLKIAHHGSGSSTTDAFLERVLPEVSIISCGRGNRYGHPHPELLKRIQGAGSLIHITMDCGAITVRTDGRKTQIKCFK